MPQQIGRYEIVNELGKGGMAVVYLARDPFMKRQVAVKVLPRQFTFDPQFRARFRREAEAIAGLEHPAIVPVYDYGEHDDQPYIVMRYMPGGSLADRMAKPRLPLDEVAALFTRLAAALDIAHERGIVHRDLKPGNILFDPWGEAYLSDFGIVKMTEASAAYTGSGIIGTPAYMSPEQASAKKDIDGRSDVYSLGVILFELLTGQLPYKADTPMGLAIAHITDPIPDIRDFDKTLPPASENVVRKVLAKKPEDRYQTASALACAIAELKPAPVPAQPDRPAPAKPKKEPTPPPPAYDDRAATVAPEVKTAPAQKARPETPRSAWAWIALIGLLIAVIAGGGWAASALSNGQATATSLAVAAVSTTTSPTAIAVMASNTVRPSRTPLPPTTTFTAPPSETDTTTSSATITAAATATNTIVKPTTATRVLVSGPTATLKPTASATSNSVVPTAESSVASTISGTVYWGLTPVSGTSVVLRQVSSGLESASITDGNGIFSFQGVPPGDWAITAIGPGGLVSVWYVKNPYRPNICRGWDFYSRESSETFRLGERDNAKYEICLADSQGSLTITQPSNGGSFSTLIISVTGLDPSKYRFDASVIDLTGSSKGISRASFGTAFQGNATYDYTKTLEGDRTIPGHCYLITVIAVLDRAISEVKSSQACRQ